MLQLRTCLKIVVWNFSMKISIFRWMGWQRLFYRMFVKVQTNGCNTSFLITWFPYGHRREERNKNNNNVRLLFSWWHSLSPAALLCHFINEWCDNVIYLNELVHIQGIHGVFRTHMMICKWLLNSFEEPNTQKKMFFF